METFRHQRSPGSDRFLGLFSPTPAASGGGGGGGGGVAGDELHEDEVFWTTPAPEPPTEPSRSSTKPSPVTANRVPNPSPATAAFGGAGVLRRVPDRSFGILAALAEDDRKRAAVTTGAASPSAPFVHRKATFAASPPAPASASASASTSPSSSAWAIPAVPKPKSEFSRSAMARSSKIYHQSAPVKVPVRPTRPIKGSGELDVGDDDEEEDYRGEAEMLPPHEIVARAWGNGTPMMTSSVLEGVGRTLKGRDLRRVRNAVLRQTGFLDNV